MRKQTKNRLAWGILAVFAILLSACGSLATTPEPVPTLVLDAGPTVTRVIASAEAVPAAQVALSFPIPGAVKTVNVKAGDAVQAGDVLAALDVLNLELAVTQAEASLRSAQSEYIYWRSPRNRPPEKQELAGWDVTIAEKRLALRQIELTQATLSAPFSGTVTSVSISAGEYAQPGQAVIVLADLANLQFETTDLSETNVTSISVGQATTIFVDALNEEFPGTVTLISPISETLGGDVVYRVTVQLDKKIDGLLWGMSAEIEFLKE